MHVAPFLFAGLALLAAEGAAAESDIPRALAPGVSIELVARDPEIVTPTGIAVDQRGNVLVIESHTHFRPADYQGPQADRIRLIRPAPAGRPAAVSTFFEGTQATMNLAVYADGSIFVATRSEICRLWDRDNDGRSDERVDLVKLVTAGNYPHNGLSGFAFDTAGNVYFGLGENLGASYELVGSDGAKHAGGGEGGSVFRCSPTGADLKRVATGFWNPFHLCFDAAGRLFAVDNDPDSRPPCRLIHVVEDGDYGYRFRNGRKGLHPFTSWNGELPGTLPMTAGTGEAPSGVIASAGRSLLVTSWGDHRIERFRLEPHGASFKSQPEPIIQGGENFRPVGIAQAPDGSFYISDWVDKSYDLHGKGRVWRIVVDGSQPQQPAAELTPGEREAAAIGKLSDRADLPLLLEHFGSADPFIRHAALRRLRALATADDLAAWSQSTGRNERLAAVLIARDRDDAQARSLLARFLADADPEVRFAAVQWIGESRLQDFRPQLKDALATAGTRDLFEACLAALELLDGRTRVANQEVAGEEYVVALLKDDRQPPAIRALALRMLRTDHPALSLKLLARLADAKDAPLRLEAIRSLRENPAPQRQSALLDIAQDANRAANERAEAIVGLDPADSASRAALEALVNDADRVVALQARRALRKPTSAPGQHTVDEWLSLIDGASHEAGAADGESGQRVFFDPRGAGCYRCHQIEGRGGRVGPDLTNIAATLNRRRLVESIVEPSREIAPLFVPWTIATKDGRVETGLLVSEDALGNQRYANSRGEIFTLAAGDVDRREPQRASIMPQDLPGKLGVDEFRDLLAYLESLRR